MTVTVKLFAVVREKAGRSEIRLELPLGSTVNAARDALSKALPDAAQYLARCAFAVNRNYAAADAALHDGDELAVIPPVSGG
jgi:molybdopterin converting factor subunit 1